MIRGACDPSLGTFAQLMGSWAIAHSKDWMTVPQDRLLAAQPASQAGPVRKRGPCPGHLAGEPGLSGWLVSARAQEEPLPQRHPSRGLGLHVPRFETGTCTSMLLLIRDLRFCPARPLRWWPGRPNSSTRRPNPRLGCYSGCQKGRPAVCEASRIVQLVARRYLAAAWSMALTSGAVLSLKTFSASASASAWVHWVSLDIGTAGPLDIRKQAPKGLRIVGRGGRI